MQAARNTPNIRTTEPVLAGENPDVVPSKLVGGGVVPLGVLMALGSAWVAVAPYAGPAFGYHLDASRAWHWNLAHALLGLVPGTVAFAGAVVVTASVGHVRLGSSRARAVLAGLVVAVCAAWLVIGPFAWPVLYHSAYFRAAGVLGALSSIAGSTVGPGLLLALLAGMAMVTARHGGAVLPVGGAGVSLRGDRLARPLRLQAVPASVPYADMAGAVPAGAVQGGELPASELPASELPARE